MANSFKRIDYGRWDVFRTSHSIPELQERRRRLAKAANSRIIGLERAKSDITGKSFIKSEWFESTLSYLDMRGRRRFSEVKNPKFLSEFELKREIVVLENFLQIKSSTVGGYRRIEENRINAFISRGVPERVARDPNFWSFLSSETFRHLAESSLDSEDIVDTFGDDINDVLTVEDIIRLFEEHIKQPLATYQDLQKRFKAKRLEKG